MRGALADMTTGAIIFLGLQGLLFAVWAFLMFRALFGLARRSLATARGQGFFGWFSHSLRQFFGYFTDPGVAGERHVLYLFTAAVVAMTVGSVFVVGPG